VIPDFAVGNYRGGAAHVGVGLEAWEVHSAMAQNAVSLVAPSFATVGAFGGFMAGGGHSSLVSYRGLASDQVLSLNVVTAGGAFVTASPTVNSDLFFALRGGGPSKSSPSVLHLRPEKRP
jgi:FAD/FMN-containing dehydrogenase